MNDELEPCPNCGKMKITTAFVDLCGDGLFRARCPNCGLTQPVGFEKRENAVIRWNTRPIEDELLRERDEAREWARQMKRDRDEARKWARKLYTVADALAKEIIALHREIYLSWEEPGESSPAVIQFKNLVGRK